MKILPSTANSEVLDNFVAAVGSQRTGEMRRYAPSADYVRGILSLLRTRPSSLWVGNDGSGTAVATACLAAIPGSDHCALGLFEFREGLAGNVAAQSILKEAIEQAREFGAKKIYAPMDANTLFNYRLPLDERADWKEWEPVYPPQAQALLKEAGFEIIETYETRSFGFSECSPEDREAVLKETGKNIGAALSAGYTLSRLSAQTAAQDLSSVAELNSRCFSGSFLYEPLPREVFLSYYSKILQRVDFSSSWICRSPQGALVGYVFAFREESSLVVKTIAVDPDHRGHKISSALAHQAFQSALEAGATEVVTALVRTGNVSELLFRREIPPSVRVTNRRYGLLGLNL